MDFFSEASGFYLAFSRRRLKCCFLSRFVGPLVACVGALDLGVRVTRCDAMLRIFSIKRSSRASIAADQEPLKRCRRTERLDPHPDTTGHAVLVLCRSLARAAQLGGGQGDRSARRRLRRQQYSQGNRASVRRRRKPPATEAKVRQWVRSPVGIHSHAII